MTYREKFLVRLNRASDILINLTEYSCEHEKQLDQYQFRECVVRLGICCELLGELIKILEYDEKPKETK